MLDALTRGTSRDPLVIVTGNHSMVKTRYTTSPLAVLDYHPAEIHAAYWLRYERVEHGDTGFHLIPNMLRVEDYRTAYDMIELAPGRNNVLVTHGLATAIKDKRLATVAEHELDSTILSDTFDYIALGHYHNQSQITTNAWYWGSDWYLTYGEIRDEKGGLVVDPARHTVGHLDLPRTPMYRLRHDRMRRRTRQRSRTRLSGGWNTSGPKSSRLRRSRSTECPGSTGRASICGPLPVSGKTCST